MSGGLNSGLDQYGAEHFERQQFGTAGVEAVKKAPDWLREFRNKNQSDSVVGRLIKQ